MMQMQFEWTPVKPTKPGWYWYQMRETRPRVIEVVKEHASQRLAVAQTGAFLDDLELEKYQWAGPIPQPHAL